MSKKKPLSDKEIDVMIEAPWVRLTPDHTLYEGMDAICRTLNIELPKTIILTHYPGYAHHRVFSGLCILDADLAIKEPLLALAAFAHEMGHKCHTRRDFMRRAGWGMASTAFSIPIIAAIEAAAKRKGSNENTPPTATEQWLDDMRAGLELAIVGMLAVAGVNYGGHQVEYAADKASGDATSKEDMINLLKKMEEGEINKNLVRMIRDSRFIGILVDLATSIQRHPISEARIAMLEREGKDGPGR